MASYLQSASDWWWGAPVNDDDDNKDSDNDDNDDNGPDNDVDTNDTKEEEEIKLNLPKTIITISTQDPITSLFKLIEYSSAIKKCLNTTFIDNNKLTETEINGILKLFDDIYENDYITNLKLSIYNELMIGEIILSYFASLSPTNPNAYKCWKRWLNYRRIPSLQALLTNVANNDLIKFYETKSNEFGYDNKGRLVWFVSTESYDGYIDDNIQRKAVILLLMSFLWDLKNNKFNLNVARKGICSHINLSNWSINMMSWSTVNAIKDAMVAFPYSLKDIYIANPPMLVYLVKTVAAQFFNPHSLDKFVFINDDDHYFKTYASKDKTPIIAKGTSKITLLQWMKDRGYVVQS